MRGGWRRARHTRLPAPGGRRERAGPDAGMRSRSLAPEDRRCLCLCCGSRCLGTGSAPVVRPGLRRGSRVAVRCRSRRGRQAQRSASPVAPCRGACRRERGGGPGPCRGRAPVPFVRARHLRPRVDGRRRVRSCPGTLGGALRGAPPPPSSRGRAPVVRWPRGGRLEAGAIRAVPGGTRSAVLGSRCARRAPAGDAHRGPRMRYR